MSGKVQPGTGLEGIIEMRKENRERVRSPGVQKMLEKLSKLDRVFDYNAPPRLLENCGDEVLYRHLEEVYSQRQFVLENAADVKKYLSWGDIVIKKGDFTNAKVVLQNGALGVVTRTDCRKGDSCKKLAIVNFEQYGSLKVEVSSLSIYGRKGSLLREEESYAVHVPAGDIQGGLQKGHQVQYIGQDVESDNKYSIPDGTCGIVVAVWESLRHPLDIIWVRGPRVYQPGIIITDSETSRSNVFFGYEDVKLVVKNHIDLRKLAAECRNPAERKAVEGNAVERGTVGGGQL